MKTAVFTPDLPAVGELLITPGAPIENPAAVITDAVSAEALAKGRRYRQRFLPLGNRSVIS